MNANTARRDEDFSGASLLRDGGEQLESILDTAFEEYNARQNRDELQAIAHLVSDTDPETVLEIGTAEGGSLYTWARYFDSADLLVSVDTHNTPDRVGRFRSFPTDAEIRCLRGESQQASVVDDVTDAVGSSGIDFLFIDGGSTESEVRQDFENFAPLVNDGGIVAFHDIVTDDDKIEDCDVCDVDEVWAEVKATHTPSVELTSDSDQDEYGYGILFY